MRSVGTLENRIATLNIYFITAFLFLDCILYTVRPPAFPLRESSTTVAERVYNSLFSLIYKGLFDLKIVFAIAWGLI